MAGMVVSVCRIADDFGDAGKRPEIRQKPVSQWSFAKGAIDKQQLLRIQFWPPPQIAGRAQRFHAAPFPTPPPSPSIDPANVQRARYGRPAFTVFE